MTAVIVGHSPASQKAQALNEALQVTGLNGREWNKLICHGWFGIVDERLESQFKSKKSHNSPIGIDGWTMFNEIVCQLHWLFKVWLYNDSKPHS